MKLKLVFLMFCAILANGAAEPEFYVWQRQPSAELEQAVGEFYKTCSGKLCFLAGEISCFYARWKAAGTLQIDLDAPESGLDYYRDLMRELSAEIKTERIKGK